MTRILAAADVQLRAMALLGLNGGFGNTDCADAATKPHLTSLAVGLTFRDRRRAFTGGFRCGPRRPQRSGWRLPRDPSPRTRLTLGSCS